MSTTKKERTALVFAGGGSLGAAQVGMLEALAEAGVVPDLLVGASVGAINAAYFASDPTRAGVERLASIWRGLKRPEVFRFSPVGVLLSLFGQRTYLCNAKVFRRFLERNLPYRLLEEARIPCHIVASEMVSGEETLISSGPVISALLASAAIPGIFPPELLAGRYLLDGGIANHTPVSTAVSLGATRLIVLPTGFTCAPEGLPQGALNMALHALNLVIARQLVQDLERFANQVELAVVPSLCPQSTHPLDFQRAGELIDRGYETTRKWLANGGLEQPPMFNALLPHRH
jgi:NTE family protein